MSIIPNTVIARVRMPADFRVSFELRRPTLPAFGTNNLLTIIESATATDLTASAVDTDNAVISGITVGQVTLLTFALNSVGASYVEYADAAAAYNGPGLTPDPVSDYTGFSITHNDGMLKIKSSAFATSYDATLSNEVFVDTTDKVYDVYVSGPSAFTDDPAGLMKSIVIEGLCCIFNHNFSSYNVYFLAFSGAL